MNETYGKIEEVSLDTTIIMELDKFFPYVIQWVLEYPYLSNLDFIEYMS